MKKTFKMLLTLTLLLAYGSLWAEFVPDPKDQMQLKVADAILEIQKKDPGLKDWFSNSAGYAVFPTVGKGGIGVGGAHGKGLVIVGDKVDGKTSMTQVTVGFQLGGQTYSEFIFFKDKVALGHFQRGNFELGAQASAVAATAGASADAAYDKGVAIFTNTKAGLMYEASVGGQKFKYESLSN